MTAIHIKTNCAHTSQLQAQRECLAVLLTFQKGESDQ